MQLMQQFGLVTTALVSEGEPLPFRSLWFAGCRSPTTTCQGPEFFAEDYLETEGLQRDIVPPEDGPNMLTPPEVETPLEKFLRTALTTLKSVACKICQVPQAQRRALKDCFCRPSEPSFMGVRGRRGWVFSKLNSNPAEALSNS